MEKILNLTPHPITVAGVVIPADGRTIRVGQKKYASDSIIYGGAEIPMHLVELGNPALVLPDGTEITLTQRNFGELLLDESEPRLFVVSAIAQQALAREVREPCFVAPGDLIRDESGRVIGAEGFAYGHGATPKFMVDHKPGSPIMSDMGRALALKAADEAATEARRLAIRSGEVD